MAINARYPLAPPCPIEEYINEMIRSDNINIQIVFSVNNIYIVYPPIVIIGLFFMVFSVNFSKEIFPPRS